MSPPFSPTSSRGNSGRPIGACSILWLFARCLEALFGENALPPAFACLLWKSVYVSCSVDIKDKGASTTSLLLSSFLLS